MKKGIIIFQKNLELGKVKTRIAKSVGDKEALEIYQVLVDYTHEQLEKVDSKKLIYYSDYKETEIVEMKGQYEVFIQSSGDLGKKMGNAFKDQFDLGYDQLVIIGTDCAEITPEVIKDAFSKLNESNVVIGPASDGGYYLLGMKKFNSGLFYNIPWSSGEVLESTINYLKDQEITYTLLPVLSDVDYIEDWNEVKDRLLNSQIK